MRDPRSDYESCWCLVFEISLRKKRGIERRTALLRAYTSRVENGHAIPIVGTLEQFASALDVPLYRFFIDDQAIKKPKLPESPDNGSNGSDRRELRRFANAFERPSDRDRNIPFVTVQKMADRIAQR